MIDGIPVPVIDDYVIIATIMASMISAMVIPVIMTVNTNRHYGKCGKIGGIISIIVRRGIGHISW